MQGGDSFSNAVKGYSFSNDINGSLESFKDAQLFPCVPGCSHESFKLFDGTMKHPDRLQASPVNPTETGPRPLR